MSGIYGDSPEDKYFENKLLNELDNGDDDNEEDEKSHTELDQDVIDKIFQFMESHNVDPTMFAILDDLILPLLEVLESNNIINHKHLNQHLNELADKSASVSKLAHIHQEIEELVKEAQHLTREK